jgi:hypothetical protein
VSVVQQGTADDFQSLACADNLWSVADAIAGGRDLVRRPGRHVGDRDSVAVGEKAIFCGYVVMRRLYGHARERHRGGVVGEEAITDRLRDARRVVLVYCRHCSVCVCCWSRCRCDESIYSRANGGVEVGKYSGGAQDKCTRQGQGSVQCKGQDGNKVPRATNGGWQCIYITAEQLLFGLAICKVWLRSTVVGGRAVRERENRISYCQKPWL